MQKYYVKYSIFLLINIIHVFELLHTFIIDNCDHDFLVLFYISVLLAVSEYNDNYCVILEILY